MHILPPVRPEKSIERLTAILEPGDAANLLI